MSLDVLPQQILIIFLMIGIGFIAQKAGLLNSDNSQVLSEVLMKIALPFTMLSSTNVDGGGETVRLMLIGFGLLMACYIVSALVCEGIALALQYPHGKRTVFVVHSVLPNSAFIGIPIVAALLGSQGVVYAGAGIMAYNLFFFTYAMALFRKGEKLSLRSFITPANLTTILMILMLVLGIRLPAALQTFSESMGALTTPLAMLIIGVMLAGSNLLAAAKNKFLYAITGLRCFVFPILFALALSFTSLNRTLCLCMVALCACASGSLGAVVAKQTGVEPELASQAVAHTTLFLMISMPLVMAVAEALL